MKDGTWLQVRKITKGLQKGSMKKGKMIPAFKPLQGQGVKVKAVGDRVSHDHGEDSKPKLAISDTQF